MKWLTQAWEWVKADEMKVRRYFRGFLGWAFGVAITLTAVGPDAMMTWSVKRWILGLAIAALPGIVGLINLGQMNPKAP